MYILISVLIVIISIVLTLIVLVQNSKGGGLASNFAGSNQIMGVRRTTDFLEKATWGLAIARVVLSLLSGVFVNSGKTQVGNSMLQEEISKQPLQQNALPVVPENTENQTEKVEEGK